MKYKRADRLIQEIDILTNKSISVDYLVNVFNVRRQSILNDLYILRDRGYNVVKIEMGTYTIKELTTKELVEQVKALNMASDRKCVKCVYYVAEYRKQHEVRPACSLNGNYSYVSHNPARLCRWYEERKNEI